MKLTESTLRKIVRKFINEQLDRTELAIYGWGGSAPTQQQVDEMLSEHLLYLRHEPGAQSANFKNADLSGLDLSRRDLSSVNFINATLTKTDFYDSNLAWADFRGAKFSNELLDAKNLQNIRCDDSKFSHLSLYYKKGIFSRREN